MKILRYTSIILMLAFLAIWQLGIIEINGATFNIVDASVTTYWDYDEEDREPFPIIPSRSRQAYEDGFVGFKPDFNQMLNDYVKGETIVGISSTFNDGQEIRSEGTDFDICIYPDNLEISKTRIKPFHHKYELRDSNIFEFEYHVPYYGRHRYFQTHSLNVDLEIEVNGICSDKYLDFKFKEIYLYYMLDALRQHVQAKEQFLQHEYLDTLGNLMFVKDNLEIDKEEFLQLDPKVMDSYNWLPSRASMEHYTTDEECIGVLIATSK